MSYIRKFTAGSPEDMRLTEAAAMMTDRSPNHWRYLVSVTYFDFGQGWEWTTIICRRPDGTEYQAFTPRDQERVITTNDLPAAIDEYFAGRSCLDKPAASLEPDKSSEPASYADAEIEAATYEPDEFEAVIAHIDRRENEKTPNIDGVYLGDLFVLSGNDGKCDHDFYQVVGLRGKHTVVLRHSDVRRVPCGDGGVVRPLRNTFTDETRYIMTSFLSGGKDVRLIPYGLTDDMITMGRCRDGQVFEYIVND